MELLAWRETGDGSFWGQVGESVAVNVREKSPPPVELVLQLRN